MTRHLAPAPTECPRCHTARKHERPREPAPAGTCWHPFHQTLTIGTAFAPEEARTMRTVR